MSNEMITTGSYQMTEAEFDELFDVNNMADDLSAGVSSGFGIISIRGSKWRIKKGGEEQPVVDAAGDPKARLEVVILRAAKEVSKTYYAGAFVEGSTEEPDCSSNNGVAPDAGCSNPQSTSCAACPQNQWGSRITDAGKKAKQCSDTRRVAVILGDDLGGANFDGPLMLRVPPASLGDLSIYGKRMTQKGFPYRGVITALGFDLDTAYPKLTFKAVRPTSREEQMQYVQFFKDGSIDNILDSTIETDTKALDKPAPVVKQAVDTEFEQAAPAPAVVQEAPAAPAPAELTPQQKAAITRKANAEKKAAEAAAAPAPVAEALAPVSKLEDGLDTALDDMLADMDMN